MLQEAAAESRYSRSEYGDEKGMLVVHQGTDALLAGHLLPAKGSGAYSG